ncbi:hypothetical protein EBU99_00635 [bacterium]|nr:hypothetical protein [bacterium]
MSRQPTLVFLLAIHFLAICATALPSLSFAYPVILNSSQFATLLGTPRNQLIALKMEASVAKRVALQIDEVEDDAALVLRYPYEVRKIRENLPHPQKNDPFAGRLQNVHRLVVDDRDFSACTDDCQKNFLSSMKSVCESGAATPLIKISLADSQKSLFLANCPAPVSELPARNIKYDSATLKITTPSYEYSQRSDKNIFFNEIRVANQTRPLLSKSELKAYLKPKYLFNMKFKDDDLISQITSLSRGQQSLGVEIAVALNLLAMKINTQICCDVSFYEDALYFPVVLDLPFSGNSFAKGSGLFFGFTTDTESNVQTEFIPAKSADASDAILIKQDKNLVALGMRNPNRKLPAVVRPKVVSAKEMEDIKFMPVQSRAGIYYDIQNAKEGFQHFMVWMLFGNEQDRAKLIDYAQNGPRIKIERITNPSEH